jgi:hypothetical protein
MVNEIDKETIEEREFDYPSVTDIRSFVQLVFVPLFIMLVVTATVCLYLVTEN